MMAGLAGALFGATKVQAPTATQVEDVATSVKGPTYTPRTFAAEKPAPAKPGAQPVAPRQVAVRAREIGGVDFTRFVDRPGRRRVKYGKNRWVILG
jgi:hypothetical protein